MDKYQRALEFVRGGEWLPVISSNVMAFRYETYTSPVTGEPSGYGILHVKFRGARGRRSVSYKYFNVPEKIARGAVLAASKGKFVHRALKDKYLTERYG